MIRTILLAIAVSAPALAAAPPGAHDPELTRWVHSLKTPEGYGCCDLADCRPTAIRPAGDGLEAWIGRDRYGDSAPDQWVRIPDGVWRGTQSDGPPPDGRAWVCWFQSAIRCAVSGGAS